MLVKLGPHRALLERQRGRGNVRPRLDHQHIAVRRQIVRSDRPARARADHDVIDLGGDLRGQQDCRRIDLDPTAQGKLGFVRLASAEFRQGELDLPMDRVGLIAGLAAGQPVAVIGTIDHRPQPGEIAVELRGVPGQPLLHAEAAVGNRLVVEIGPEERGHHGKDQLHRLDRRAADQLELLMKVGDDLRDRDRHLGEPVEHRFGEALDEQELVLVEWSGHAGSPIAIALISDPAVSALERLLLAGTANARRREQWAAIR